MGYFVHEHKGPLVAVVDIFKGRVSQTALLHLCLALLQGVVPEVAATEQQRLCLLVQLIESGLPVPWFEPYVVEPAFDRELVPHDFFLICKVLFF